MFYKPMSEEERERLLVEYMPRLREFFSDFFSQEKLIKNEHIQLAAQQYLKNSRKE